MLMQGLNILERQNLRSDQVSASKDLPDRALTEVIGAQDLKAHRYVLSDWLTIIGGVHRVTLGSA
ncbi:MAG: hypothetical protein E6R06_21835 [Mycobacterium sp.]|nr:MAG: hypothetical protein E6R06_21835 [Mycobacterium sp.]